MAITGTTSATTSGYWTHSVPHWELKWNITKSTTKTGYWKLAFTLSTDKLTSSSFYHFGIDMFLNLSSSSSIGTSPTKIVTMVNGGIKDGGALDSSKFTVHPVTLGGKTYTPTGKLGSNKAYVVTFPEMPATKFTFSIRCGDSGCSDKAGSNGGTYGKTLCGYDLYTKPSNLTAIIKSCTGKTVTGSLNFTAGSANASKICLWASSSSTKPSTIPSSNTFTTTNGGSGTVVNKLSSGSEMVNGSTYYLFAGVKDANGTTIISKGVSFVTYKTTITVSNITTNSATVKFTNNKDTKDIKYWIYEKNASSTGSSALTGAGIGITRATYMHSTWYTVKARINDIADTEVTKNFITYKFVGSVVNKNLIDEQRITIEVLGKAAASNAQTTIPDISKNVKITKVNAIGPNSTSLSISSSYPNITVTKLTPFSTYTFSIIITDGFNVITLPNVVIAVGGDAPITPKPPEPESDDPTPTPPYIYVFHNGKWCTALPYIFHNGKWSQASTFVKGSSGWMSKSLN